MPSLASIRSSTAAYKPLVSPTIVCTGGTAGIGEHIARKLTELSKTPRVHLVGRNETAANAIIEDLKKQNPAGSYRFHKCDFSSVADTKRFVSSLRNEVDEIDYLVVSQGIFTMAGRTETSEGNDVKMMLHYYSRMAVIDGLKDKLAPNSRVMSVLDSTRGNISKLNWEDLDLKKTYSLGNAATHCITMTDIALQCFSRELPKTDFIHAYPGIVKTELSRNLSLPAAVAMKSFFFLAGTSASDCAEYLCHPLLLQDLTTYKVGGAAFCGSKGDPVQGKAESTQEQQERLWQHTQSIIS